MSQPLSQTPQDVTGDGVTMSQTGFSEQSSGEIASVTVTDDLLANGKLGTLHAQKIALRSIFRAPEAIGILSQGDLKTALSTVRIAAGMDSGEGSKVAVQVQLWQSPAYRQATQSDPFEVEAIASDGEPVSTDISDY